MTTTFPQPTPTFIAWGKSYSAVDTNGRQCQRREHYGIVIGQQGRRLIALSAVDAAQHSVAKSDARALDPEMMKENAKKWNLKLRPSSNGSQ